MIIRFIISPKVTMCEMCDVQMCACFVGQNPLKHSKFKCLGKTNLNWELKK